MDENALRGLSDEQISELEREGFDRTEPSGPWIVAFTLAIVVTLIVVTIGVHYLFQATYDQNEYRQVLAAESQELQEVRTREAELLNHYRYSDRSRSAVRLPIERAMTLFAAEASAGKLFYPAKPAPVKTAEALATGPDGSVSAAPAAAASNSMGVQSGLKR